MYSHQNTDWPKLRWNDPELLPLLGEIRHRQGRLIGRMEGLGFRLREEAKLNALASDVLKSSAIEGEKLDREEVRSSIARRLGIKFAGAAGASRNVEGVVEMMLDATQRYRERLTRERLFGWHASLFPTGYGGMQKITVGAWRTPASGAMQVVSGPIGRERVHFEAPTAEKLDGEMAAFLAWFEADNIDLVLKSGVAHLWFVTIHPFEDGNGRIGRAIADMALARAEGTSDRFYSMSAEIEAHRREYYDQLEAAQRGGLDITSWLKWYLECLRHALDSAQNELENVLKKARIWERINARSVNDRQRMIINRLVDGFEGKMTSAKYAKIAKCSHDTALRDIKALIEWDLLAQDQAGGRSTSYHLAGFPPEAPTSQE